MTPPAPDAGHRLVPHTADLRLEAWASTRGGCIGEAVRALVESFVDPGAAAPQRYTSFAFDRENDDLLLGRVLDEVIYLVEVFGEVPIDVFVADTENGGVAGDFGLVPVDQVRGIGATPKAVTMSGLVPHVRGTGGSAGRPWTSDRAMLRRRDGPQLGTRVAFGDQVAPQTPQITPLRWQLDHVS